MKSPLAWLLFVGIAFVGAPFIHGYDRQVSLHGFPIDPSVVSMMLTLLIVLSQRSLCVWDRSTEKLAILGLASGCILMTILAVAIPQPSHYFWVARLVLAGFGCAVLAKAFANLSRARVIVIAAIIVTGLCLQCVKISA